MAEYIIKANTDTIRSTTDKFESQRAVMDGCMRDMKARTDELQNYFISDAGRAYAEKCISLFADIQMCLDNLGTEIAALRSAAGIFEEANQRTVTSVNSVSSTGAFANTQ